MYIKIVFFLLSFFLTNKIFSEFECKNLVKKLVEFKIKNVLLLEKIKKIKNSFFENKENKENKEEVLKNFKEAIKELDINKVRECLNKKVDLNAKLAFKSESEDVSSLWYICSRFNEENQINEENKKLKEIMEVLIEKGADIGFMNSINTSALWFLADKEKLEIICCFVDKLKEINSKEDKEKIKKLIFQEVKVYDKLISILKMLTKDIKGKNTFFKIMTFIDEETASNLANIEKEKGHYWLSNIYDETEKKLNKVYGEVNALKLLDSYLGYYGASNKIVELIYFCNFDKSKIEKTIIGDIHTLLAFDSFPEFLRLIDKETIDKLDLEKLKDLKVSWLCDKKASKEVIEKIDLAVGENLRKVLTKLYLSSKKKASDFATLMTKYKEMAKQYEDIIEYIRNGDIKSIRDLEIKFEGTSSVDTGGVKRSLINAFCSLYFLSTGVK